jgi:hypothetical protein
MKDEIATLCFDLERLRRHYDLAVKTYDQIALVELSHTLRYWSEMQETLADQVPSLCAAKPFKVAGPTKHARRVLAGHEFILSHLPGGAITFASKGELALLPESWRHHPGSISIMAKPNQDQSLEMSSYCVVRQQLKPDQLARLRGAAMRTVGYSEWLDSVAVRVGMPRQNRSIEVVGLSLRTLIERVANEYQGSHPRLGKDRANGIIKPNSYVAYLMDFGWGGLPLPYFILLKAAQDILRIVGAKVMELA